MPKIALVQAEGASPFHTMMIGGRRELVPFDRPSTIATAVNIGHPPSWKKARDLLESVGGTTCSVTDGEILEAKRLIDRSGIGCEPASAATVAGLRKLVASGTIDKDETAACILTGNLLKDTDILRQTLWENEKRRTQAAELTLESIKGWIGCAESER